VAPLIVFLANEEGEQFIVQVVSDTEGENLSIETWILVELDLHMHCAQLEVKSILFLVTIHLL
jgi:hypothetical protein